MEKARICYKLKYEEGIVSDWRADMENYSGFDVTIIKYRNGKVGVGIDRVGFFIFRNKEVLMDHHSAEYVAEKLTTTLSDAACLIFFFRFALDDKSFYVTGIEGHIE